MGWKLPNMAGWKARCRSVKTWPWDFIAVYLVIGSVLAVTGFFVFSFVFGSRIHRAVRANDIARVTQLLAAGANPEERTANLTTKEGWDNTPLLLAVETGSPEMIALLVSHGADPNRNPGYPPLEKAIALRKESVGLELLRHGSDPNRPKDLLYRAIESGQTELAMELVRRGADVNVMNNQDTGTYERLVWWEDVCGWELIRLMCEAGLDLSFGNRARDIGRYGPQDVVECALSRATKDHPWRQVILSELQSRTDEEGQRIRTSLGLDDATSPSPPEPAEEGSR